MGSDSVMVWLLVTLFTSLTTLASAQKGYGPVDLDAVDPLSLSWNQIHWLVRDQIKEVEELKAEHDEIYNEIAGCYGLEKCLGEFDLVDIQPGTKLWNLGLRKVDLSTSELSRQRDELEEMRIQELQRQKEEIRRQEALEKQKLEAARAALAASSSSSSSKSSSSSSSSGWSETSSSYSRSSVSSSAQGQPFFGQTGGYSSNFFSNQSTIYGPKPEVFDRGYKYTYTANSRSSSSRSRGYNG